MNLARFTSITIGAAVLALAPVVATAADDLAYDIKVQTAAGGFKYVTGGVGDAEQAIMSSRFNDYSYKLVNVKSGPDAAFVSEVHVVIWNEKDNKVLETTTDGPWLIANLPAGDYTIKATFENVTKTKTITLVEDANQRMVIDWRTDGETKELTGPG